MIRHDGKGNELNRIEKVEKSLELSVEFAFIFVSENPLIATVPFSCGFDKNVH